MKAPVLTLRVFDGHQHSASPFSAHADSLRKAEHDQEDRRENADPLVRGKQADGEGGDSHDHQRINQHPLAPLAIAVMAENQTSHRTRYESHGESSEGRESSRQRVHVRKEQLVEHERRRGSVQEEVIPLDRGSDKARQYYSSNGSRFLGIIFCPHVSPLSIPRVEYHEHRHSAALTA